MHCWTFERMSVKVCISVFKLSYSCWHCLALPLILLSGWLSSFRAISFSFIPWSMKYLDVHIMQFEIRLFSLGHLLNCLPSVFMMTDWTELNEKRASWFCEWFLKKSNCLSLFNSSHCSGQFQSRFSQLQDMRENCLIIEPSYKPYGCITSACLHVSHPIQIFFHVSYWHFSNLGVFISWIIILSTGITNSCWISDFINYSNDIFCFRLA